MTVVVLLESRLATGNTCPTVAYMCCLSLEISTYRHLKCTYVTVAILLFVRCTCILFLHMRIHKVSITVYALYLAAFLHIESYALIRIITNLLNLSSFVRIGKK